MPDLEGDPSLATVKVTGADGRPYRGIQWMWTRREPQLALGKSQMLTLAVGTWTIRVEAPDGRAWQGQATVGAGENPDLVLE